jgi:hypothetical protein
MTEATIPGDNARITVNVRKFQNKVKKRRYIPVVAIA